MRFSLNSIAAAMLLTLGLAACGNGVEQSGTSAPAASTRATSSPRRAKSADKIEGAIRYGLDMKQPGKDKNFSHYNKLTLLGCFKKQQFYLSCLLI